MQHLGLQCGRQFFGQRLGHFLWTLTRLPNKVIGGGGGGRLGGRVMRMIVGVGDGMDGSTSSSSSIGAGVVNGDAGGGDSDVSFGFFWLLWAKAAAAPAFAAFTADWIFETKSGD